LARCGRPVVWDPHPRGPEPVAGCRVVTPNTRELSALFAPPGDDEAGTGTGSEVRSPALGKLTGQARRALVAWQAQSIAVTRGDQGALLVTGDGPPLVVPPERRLAGDSCGAGDCFAASLAGRLAAGGLPSEAVTAAVADAFSFVAAGAAPAWFDRRRSVDGPQHRDHQDDRDDRRGPGAPDRLVSQVRARGGTVVATGGCFDLLHAGHLSVLRAARALGDCLIVCLNSDRSVRRLKGPTRPVIPEAERAALLATLECVDAVCVFDEDTPDELLARLRPDIWAKGGDYDANNLPEAATVAGWGGQTVTVPYLSGHSTTDLLRRAATGGG
jgi:rfaE bifunctional protein nucleotidyltransferase chain/domain